MADSPPNVRLNLANTPENVVLVREMLSGVGEAVELSPSDLNDVRTAVTEACNNVVLHAYEGDPGPLEIELYLAGQSLGVLVRDHGIGLSAESMSLETDAGGIGLHVIQTLTQTVEFAAGEERGTDVWMWFNAPQVPPHAPPHLDGDQAQTLALSGVPTTTICIAPISLARTILPRLMITLAAHAHFSTDRISDAQLLADALVEHAQAAISGDKLSIDVTVELRDLELHISPLNVGRAQQLIEQSELGGLNGVIAQLTDRHRVVSSGAHETLTLGLSDPR
ncbi:MAG TPA: ATP-binding protein [Solirubrobacteraceae bacterium]|jgi:anti-sigma regulatory factor (Ser/Thr protein kinase)|nr:ATP-binding protein [Solirubrobacteraceae bacterium]